MNSNFDAIETAFADSVSASQGGTMEVDLDMNSNQLLNLKYPVYPSNAATKEYVDELALGIVAGISFPVVIGSSGVASSVTGTTSETVLATIRIPGGAMGPNGFIRITSTWSFPNNANSKILRCRHGGLTGSAFLSQTQTTTQAQYSSRVITNRNNPAIQTGATTGLGTSFGGAGAANYSGAIDTTTDQDLVFTGTLGNSADTITLESYIVELMYKA